MFEAKQSQSLAVFRMMEKENKQHALIICEECCTERSQDC